MAGDDERASDAETMADAALERSRTMAAAGQARAALANARQAVRLYRDLAAREPAVFLPDLALALQTLADLAGGAALDQQEEALLAAREAVSLFRTLAGRPVSGTSPDDGSSEGSAAAPESPARSAAADSPAEDSGAGPAGTQESPSPPADDEPALFRPYLGAALGTLAARLHEGGADDEALATVREGIHLFDNADPDDLRRHRQALDAARLLRNELSPDEHLQDEEFGAMFAGSPDD